MPVEFSVAMECLFSHYMLLMSYIIHIPSSMRLEKRAHVSLQTVSFAFNDDRDKDNNNSETLP